jgi:hypothetical protein
LRLPCSIIAKHSVGGGEAFVEGLEGGTLSKSYGARPTRAAICLRLIFPSSGNRAMSVKASTGPTPGIEVSSS